MKWYIVKVQLTHSANELSSISFWQMSFISTHISIRYFCQNYRFNIMLNAFQVNRTFKNLKSGNIILSKDQSQDQRNTIWSIATIFKPSLGHMSFVRFVAFVFDPIGVAGVLSGFTKSLQQYEHCNQT